MQYARLRLLVAVSTPQLANEICSFFTDLGVTAITTVSAMYEAVDLMLEHEFSIFIVDGQLLYAIDQDRARIAGADLVRFIRMCRGPVSEVPVIFLRSLKQRQNLLEANAEIEEARQAGANYIMAQPVDFDALGQAVTKLFAEPGVFIREGAYIGPCRRQSDISVTINRRRKG